MNDEAPIDFCKVDSDLDANPKIQAAGCFGRDVFEFVLRANRRMRRDGSIPLRYVELGYLARQLMFDGVAAQFGVDPIELARRALAAACEALLLEIDPIIGEVRIVGWEEEWGTRKPKPVRERVRAHRERQKAIALAEPVTAVTPSDAGNAIEIRSEGEEKRGEDQTLSPDSDIRPELPDPGAIVPAEREVAQEPPPGIPMPGSRNRRIKLGHDAWYYAVLKHAELTAIGLEGSQHWPAIPVGDAMHELIKRRDEVLEMLTTNSLGPDFARAAKTMRDRIDVAAAEAIREKHLRWFTPSKVFDSKQFWRALEITPADAARPRAGPRGSPPSVPPRRIRKLD